MKTVLFFIAGNAPTVAEQAKINRIAGEAVTVKVRRVDNGDVTFTPNPEACDFVAGASIPAAYEEVDVLTVSADPTAPDQFAVYPAAVSIAAAGTQQLAAVAAVKGDAGLPSISDKAADAAVVWSSSDETKATVGADGLVTGVAAGAAVITATYTHAVGKTVTSTAAITVTA